MSVQSKAASYRRSPSLKAFFKFRSHKVWVVVISWVCFDLDKKLSASLGHVDKHNVLTVTRNVNVNLQKKADVKMSHLLNVHDVHAAAGASSARPFKHLGSCCTEVLCRHPCIIHIHEFAAFSPLVLRLRKVIIRLQLHISNYHSALLAFFLF